MAKTCEFEVGEDQIIFVNRTNGDHIKLDGMHLVPEQAANLAWMIQSGCAIRVEFQEVVPEVE